ncbi:hypothetical protein FMUBM48_55210 [Nocardia cyriacigeorgica]|nr:hypothetical protein FMUBM48_55210 [Nocardia cyriacigeorgica]
MQHRQLPAQAGCVQNSGGGGGDRSGSAGRAVHAVNDPEPRAWVQWDDGTWSTVDEFGMPSERRTLEEILQAWERGEPV